MLANSPTSWIDATRSAFNAICLTDMGQRKLLVDRVQWAELVLSSEMTANMPQSVWVDDQWLPREASDVTRKEL